MPEDLIAAPGHLKQTDEVWEGTARLARMCNTPKHGPPYRRSFVLLTDGQRSVLVNKLFDAPPTAEELWLALGAYPDAVTQFEEAQALADPDTGGALNELAQSYTQMGARLRTEANRPLLPGHGRPGKRRGDLARSAQTAGAPRLVGAALATPARPGGALSTGRLSTPPSRHLFAVITGKR